jgi:general secretion pathway protein G
MKKSYYKESSKGFTLIELLVVISIIGFLASIVTTRRDPRDVSRKASLRQIQTAIELYFEDNGAYPSTANLWRSSEPDNGGIPYHPTDYVPGLVPNYVSALPRDPIGGDAIVCGAGWKKAYVYRSNGTGYKLLSLCSLEADFKIGGLSDPRRDAGALPCVLDGIIPSAFAVWTSDYTCI